MSKERSKDESLRLNYFYGLFLKRKKLFPTSYFMFPVFTRKKKIPLEKTLYKKIINTYLDIYFNEFYFADVPKYFMLSGMLMKVKGSRFIINKKKGSLHQDRSIGWVWYLRPSLAYISNIRLIKLKGGTGKVNKLDATYKKNKDVEMLSSTNRFREQLMNDNKLYKACLVD